MNCRTSTLKLVEKGASSNEITYYSSFEMARNLAMLDAVIESTVDGIVVYSLDQHIVKMNSTYCQMMKLDKYDAYLSDIETHLSRLMGKCENGHAFLRRIEKHLHSLKSDKGFILKFKDNRYYQITNSPYTINGELLGRVIGFHDITTQKRTELNLIEREALYKDLSIRDNLTGIYNRRKLLLELKHCFENQKNNRIDSLIIFDLDNFKLINDTYGHSMGDFVLQRISESISACLRKKDIFARWGGDEFIILLPDCPYEKAIKYIDKINSRLNHLGLPLKHPISCSFGIATTAEENCPEALIHKADMAMYHLKAHAKQK